MALISHPTVTRLLEAISKSGDFPGMAKTVGLIGSLTASEATSSAMLADSILQDYGLTQKVLRLVNTFAYAQREQVTTISRAVVLMGFERIRSVATGLVVFEHLQKQAGTGPLVDTLNMAFFSAVLGRNIAEDSAAVNAEEAFICSLFHRLGRLLVAFYLPQEYSAILAVEPAQQEAETRDILGLSFQQVGSAIAYDLKLPQRVGESMVRVSGADSRGPLGPGARLGCLATLTNDITDVLATPNDPLKKRAAIQRLLKSYEAQFTVTQEVDALIGKSMKDLTQSSEAFQLQLPDSPFLAGIGEWRVATLVAPGAGERSAVEASSAGTLSWHGELDESGLSPSETPEAILTNGLHEVTSLLSTDYAVDDVLSVTLETMYRALGVGRARVFFLMMDPSTSSARFRFGFGHTPGEPRHWAAVPIKGTGDLFSLSITQQKDIVIRDAKAPEVAHALPGWFTKRGVPDRYLILLPLVVNQRAVGLVYVDGETAGVTKLTPAVINGLKLLRGHAVLGICQKAARPAVRK